MSGAAVLPRLHVVTDDAVFARADFVALAKAMVRTGRERLALHLRAPRAGGRLLHQRAALLAPVAAEAGALLVVNDRLDVALASGAAGVQLGGRSLTVADARRLTGEGEGMMVGASVHDRGGAEAALAEGADFVLAGMIFSSESHPGRAGTGAGWLGSIDGGGGRVIGIGGVGPERVEEVLAAGAHGVAVIRAVWGAERPAEVVRRFIEILYGENGVD